MEDESASSPPPLILGRPFLKTAKTKIDVHAGTLSMEFGDDIIQFNIFDAMKYPLEDHSVFHFDVIDLLVDDMHADMLAEFPEIVGYTDSIACDTCSACFGLFGCKPLQYVQPVLRFLHTYHVLLLILLTLMILFLLLMAMMLL